MVTRRLLMRLLWASTALPAMSCVASFDTHADNACEGSCDGGTSKLDATFFDGRPIKSKDSGSRDGFEEESNEPPDAADCSALNEGEACASATTCSDVWTCHAGVCTPNPVSLPDGGLACGKSPPVCHAAPMCAEGLCAPPALLPDNTPCAAAPVCHGAPTCKGGVCGEAPNAADGTSCGPAPDDCHDPPKCSGGKCQAAVARSDGTPWGGGGINMCCNGKAIQANGNGACGVCGWTCTNGTQCAEIDGHFLCQGCLGGGDCLSGCCSTDPAPNHCSPSNCAGECPSPSKCPDGSKCMTSSTVDFCTYSN